jgi:pimeloyl-ACP methyl ester carboxylesterase
MVDVDGHQMRVQTIGLDGADARDVPTVVLEAGFMLDGISAWTSIIEDVAAFAPVIAYDRAGIGQSEVDGESPTPEHIAENLHALLGALGAEPPYVLVGHSLGGPFIRMFTALYPDEVAGLVHVDPTATMSEGEQTAMYAAMGSSAEERRSQIDEQPDMPTPGTRAEMELIIDRSENHWPSFRDLPPVPDVPVSVLMAARYDPSPARGVERDCEPRECHARGMEVRMAWLQKLAAAVTNGTLTVVTNSGHFIQNDDPDLVVWNIRRVVEAEPLKAVVELPASMLAEYVGVYEAQPGAQFTVTLDDGQVFVMITGQQALPVYATEPDEFFLRAVHAQISFVRDADGAVNQLVLHQNGRDIPWQRVR